MGDGEAPMISEESAESARVYDATATQYIGHIGTEISSAIEAPLDRALMTHELPSVWAETHRLLLPGGRLLLGFQAGGGERVERPDAQGSGHTLINIRHDPAAVVSSLESSGFEIESLTTRAAAATHEASPQSFVIARNQSPAMK